MQYKIYDKFIFLIYFCYLNIVSPNNYEIVTSNGILIDTAVNNEDSKILIVYSSDGNIIIQEYDNNDGILESKYTHLITYSSSSRFVYLSGLGYYILANLESYLFSKSNLSSYTTISLSLTSTSTYQNSFKSSAGYLPNDNLLFIAVAKPPNEVYLEIFRGTSSFIFVGSTIFDSHDTFFSCIGIKLDSRIICLYKETNGKEKGLILTKDFNRKYIDNIDPSFNMNSYGEILIYSDYNNNQILYCILKNEYLYCNIGQYYSPDRFENICPMTESRNFAAAFPCQQDFSFVSVTMVGNDNYAVICKDEVQPNKFFFSQVSFILNGRMAFVHKNKSISVESNTSYLRIATIQSKYISIFFNHENSIFYSILYYPHCNHFSIVSTIKNELKQINFSSYIWKGINETSPSTKLKIVSIEPNKNIKLYSIEISTSQVVLDQIYPFNSIYYETGNVEGKYIIQFTPVNSNNEGIVKCNLSIEIKRCFSGCGSCEEIGTETDMKCLTCNNEMNYYRISGDSSNNCYYLTNHYYLKDNVLHHCYNSCLTCNGEGNSISNNCITCDESNGYYRLPDTLSDCTNNKPSNTYLDLLSGAYLKCYFLCEECLGGYSIYQHNCTSCKTSLAIQHPLIPTNCVIPCPTGSYWYLDDNMIYKCLSNPFCPESRPILENNNNQCVENCKHTGTCVYCRNNIVYEYNNKCISQCPSKTFPSLADRKCVVENSNCQFETYESNILLENLANSINDTAKNYSIQYQHTERQVVLINGTDGKYKTIIYEHDECIDKINNITKVNFHSCIEILREKYSISSTEPLIFLVTEIKHNTTSTKQTAYAIYNKQGIPLNLNYCSIESFQVKVPITNPDLVHFDLAYNMSLVGVDIYNINDPFFNDICFPFTSEQGKDVSLEDRREDYYKNVSFCEADCEYEGIDYLTKEAKCQCTAKSNFITEALNNPITSDMFEMLQSANIKIFKCYKNVFNLQNLKRNLGSWIMILLFMIEFIFFCVYLKYKIISIKKFLYNSINAPPTKVTRKKSYIGSDKMYVNSDQNNNHKNEKVFRNFHNQHQIISENSDHLCVNSKNKNNIESSKNDKLVNPQRKSSQMIVENILNESSLGFEEKKKNNSKNKKEDLNNKKRKSNKKVTTYSYLNRSEKKDITNSQIFSAEKFNKSKINFQFTPPSSDRSDNSLNDEIQKKRNQEKHYSNIISNNIQKVQENEEDLSDEELNELCIEDAKTYDHRSLCEFYFNLLKDNQDIINIFCNVSPLDSFPIRCICFFFGMGFYFFVNALFFIESYLSSSIHGEGNYGFYSIMQNEMNRLVFSTMVTVLVNMFENCLSSSKKRLEILIKKEKNKQIFFYESYKILNGLVIKHRLFFITVLLLDFVFWYYTSAFANIYYNSRINWIEGGLITFLLTNIFSFLYCLLIAVLRFVGLKCNYCKCCYQISQLLL